MRTPVLVKSTSVLLTQYHSNIAIVDDHRDIRDLVGKYLHRHGYRTSLAENAAACRRLLERNAIDLVVLDVIDAGRGSGCRCAAICGNRPICRSSCSPPWRRRPTASSGWSSAPTTISKPFNPRELLARIKAVLRRVQSLPPQRGQLKAKGGAFRPLVAECRAARAGRRGWPRRAAQHRGVPACSACSSTMPGWC